jgi:transposase
MPKSRDTNSAERSVIIALHAEGVSINQLAHRYHIDRRTVTRICSRYRQTGSVENLQRSGRGRSTTVRDDRVLHRLQRQTPMASSSHIAHQFQQHTGKFISACTR